MTKIFRSAALFVWAGLASAALAATPPIDVTVSDAAGKLAFRGKTSTNGTFSTPRLEPGNYVVQFNSAKLQGDYAMIVSAGKKKVTADSVAGSQFGGGGVAMRLEVGRGLNISGQVAPVGTVMVSGNRKVKIVNGRRYIWVEGETGTNLRGWVEEGVAKGRNIQRMSRDTIRQIQDKGEGLGGG